MKDPIVESVREAREEHAKKFNYNLHDICEDLRSKQKDTGHKVVSLPPKRITKTNVPRFLPRRDFKHNTRSECHVCVRRKPLPVTKRELMSR